MSSLLTFARDIRIKTVELCHRAGTPHLGSALSVVDILAVAYGSVLNIGPETVNSPERDRFILSKGHAVVAQYATLALKSFFPESDLDHYSRDGSHLAEHPMPRCVPGIELATGSLGHGLSVGLGMALAARLHGFSYHTMVVLSDGECNEGSVWEAALFAAAKNLNTITAIIDYNKWQATGRSDEVLGLAPLAEKWKAFGWEVIEIDGNDVVAVEQAMRQARGTVDSPSVIIAHTVKGRGVSFMEDDNNWHYRIPSADEVERARTELMQ